MKRLILLPILAATALWVTAPAGLVFALDAQAVSDRHPCPKPDENRHPCPDQDRHPCPKPDENRHPCPKPDDEGRHPCPKPDDENRHPCPDEN